MALGTLLRRPTPQPSPDPNVAAASSSSIGSGSIGRTRLVLEADQHLLYRQVSSHRGSYQSNDGQSIGSAPIRSDAGHQTRRPSKSPDDAVAPSQRRNTSASLAPSGLPSPSTASTHLQPEAPPVNRYDRLFGLSSSPSATPATLPTIIPNSQTSMPPPSAPSAQIVKSETKQKSPYPPPSSSTGTSRKDRNATAGTSFFRRNSLRRRNSSNESLPHRKEGSSSLHGKSASIPAPESNPSADIPSHPALTPSTIMNRSTTTPLQPALSADKTSQKNKAPLVASGSSSGPGRFARLFGRRKSISAPSQPRPSAALPPTPAQPTPANTLAPQPSPPMAIISAAWKDPSQAESESASAAPTSLPTTASAASHASFAHTPTSDPTSSLKPADQPTNNFASPSANSQQHPVSSGLASSSLLVAASSSEAERNPAFSFPSRNSINEEHLPTSLSQTQGTTHEGNLPPNLTSSRKAKHSNSRSLPLASLESSVSMPFPLATPEASQGEVVGLQRRPSRMARTLGHRSNSMSLSVLNTLFGTNNTPSNTPELSTDTTSSSIPGSQHSIASLASTNNARSSTAHARRPSLRARLKIGRLNSAQASNRPSTPEIESWRQRGPDGSDVDLFGAHARRASTDVSQRSQLEAQAPVQITRSRSTIRRKPAPEIRQEEIESSSSTPVYGKALRTLDVDQDPTLEAGSRASSPLAATVSLQGHTSRRSSVATAVQALILTKSGSPDRSQKDTRPSSSHRMSALGLYDAGDVSPKQVDSSSVPVLGVLTSSPPSSVSSNPTSDVKGGGPLTPSPAADDGAHRLRPETHLLPPSTSSHNVGKRHSSGALSAADTSGSVERPWSLISSGETDTPLLGLRKLVVDTNGDDSKESDDEGLFFRPAAESCRSDAPPRQSVLEQSQSSVTASEKTPDHAPLKMIDASAADNLQKGLVSHDHIDEDRNVVGIASTIDDDPAHVRPSSRTTAESDLKHEIPLINSEQSTTLADDRQNSGPTLAASARSDATASAASTIRFRNPAVLASAIESAAMIDRDRLGPLPDKSSQHSRERSTSSNLSDSTIQQGRRASAASRITTTSSGHWSESRLSEDALSALEAEVGQVRKAEVVTLGKGRVKDWVDVNGSSKLMPSNNHAPTLSRSVSLRKKNDQSAVQEDRPTRMDEAEVQRQDALNDALSQKLHSLYAVQAQSVDALPNIPVQDIRDIPDEESNEEISTSVPPLTTSMSAPVVMPFEFNFNTFPAVRNTASHQNARLSAFHDRKLDASDTESQASHVTVQVPEEAVRLGRAPSKRVRRSVSEVKSAGEAVMVVRDAQTRVLPVSNGTGKDGSMARRGSAGARAAQRRSVSLSSSQNRSPRTNEYNPSLVPLVPSLPRISPAPSPKPSSVNSVNRTESNRVDSTERKALSLEGTKDGREPTTSQHSKSRSYATSEEAAKAKQRELLERERRHRDREAKRQLELQEKYAKKKQSDPLLAARLALAGLQRPAIPSKLSRENTESLTRGMEDDVEAHSNAKPSMGSMSQAMSETVAIRPTGLTVPSTASRQMSDQFLSVLPTPVSRKSSLAGSLTSFHTAVDGLSNPSSPAHQAIATLQESPERSGAKGSKPRISETSSTSKSSRPETAHSIISSLTVDFEFPVPPQRMKEQFSEDGTLLARAGLKESPRTTTSLYQPPRAPQRDSSLRYNRMDLLNLNSNSKPIPGSLTLDNLASLSPLSSIKEVVALKRSRSVGYNSRDLRNLSRQQMLQDAWSSMIPDNGSLGTEKQATGLGIVVPSKEAVAEGLTEDRLT